MQSHSALICIYSLRCDPWATPAVSPLGYSKGEITPEELRGFSWCYQETPLMSFRGTKHEATTLHQHDGLTRECDKGQSGSSTAKRPETCCKWSRKPCSFHLISEPSQTKHLQLHCFNNSTLPLLQKRTGHLTPHKISSEVLLATAVLSPTPFQVCFFQGYIPQVNAVTNIFADRTRQ